MTNSELNIRKLRRESFLLASDGQFLGQLSSNKYLSESVMNEFGTYGSPYSSFSIFNKYGTYGNPYSPNSPFNQFSTTPPKIYLRGIYVGYLSINTFLQNCLDPHQLYDYIISNGL